MVPDNLIGTFVYFSTPDASVYIVQVRYGSNLLS